jgi:hypothetical protein
MARYFQISTAEGMSAPKLDSQGCATLQIKAKNVTGAAVDSRPILVSLPITVPPSGAVQNGWVKIEGPAEQRFEKDQEKVFVVKIAVPKKDKPKPGTYQFRLDVVSVAVTDLGDSSQVIAFTVPETKQEPSHFPLWLIPVLLVVAIGIGVGLWLALRSGGPKVPDLVGMTATAADTAVQGVGMTLDPKTVDSKPEDAGKILSQSPDKGQKATKGGKVEVTVGAQSAKTVPVKSVVGQNLGQAIVTLEGIGLIVTPLFTGDTTKTVVSQSPAPPASVQVGSSVTLTFPVGSCAGKPCFFTGNIAHQMIVEQAAQARARGIQPK